MHLLNTFFQVTSDSADWNYTTGYDRVGPTVDHTTRSRAGHYLAVPASPTGASALILSPNYAATGIFPTLFLICVIITSIY